MPERVLNQIKYLCRNIAKVEWSGVLFYSVEGSIKDPHTMVLTLQDILPMNKGTSTYTEYSFDERVIDYMMDNETMEKGWKMGHIHSHNTMAVFFSGTDWSELNDNAPNHNFYLSLIVNNFMDFCAKVCFIAESDSSKQFDFTARDENGKKYIYKSEEYEVKEKKLIVYDCAIMSPKNDIVVDESFASKVSGIIKVASDAEEKAAALRASQPKVTSIVAPENGVKSRHMVGQEVTHGGKEWEWDEKDFTGKSISYLEKGKKIKDLDGNQLEDSIEEFAAFIMGTASFGYTDVEDACAYHCRTHTVPMELASEIVKDYGSYYDTFYEEMEDKDVVKNFLTITELTIEELENEEGNSRYAAHKNLLKPVIAGLTQFVVNFKKYGTE